jgi:chromosome segregation ATPase
MTRANKTLAILLVAVLGLWGCAKDPSGGNAALERVKALEAKNAKLEDDYRALNAAREQLRQRVQTLEDQAAQLPRLTKQRDTLKQQLDTRTTERDAVQAQFDQFRTGIRNLLGQAEAAATRATQPPVTSSAEVAASGKT